MVSAMEAVWLRDLCRSIGIRRSRKTLVTREALGQALLLSFGRDARLHDVGHGSSRGSDHSRWDWASHGGESPPLREHHGLSSIWYCWKGCWLSFEDMLAPYRPPGLTREVADHSSNSQCPAPQFNKTDVANLVISIALALCACLLLSRSIGTRCLFQPCFKSVTVLYRAS